MCPPGDLPHPNPTASLWEPNPPLRSPRPTAAGPAPFLWPRPLGILSPLQPTWLFLPPPALKGRQGLSLAELCRIGAPSPPACETENDNSYGPSFTLGLTVGLSTPLRVPFTLWGERLVLFSASQERPPEGGAAWWEGVKWILTRVGLKSSLGPSELSGPGQAVPSLCASVRTSGTWDAAVPLSRGYFED